MQQPWERPTASKRLPDTRKTANNSPGSSQQRPRGSQTLPKSSPAPPKTLPKPVPVASKINVLSKIVKNPEKTPKKSRKITNKAPQTLPKPLPNPIQIPWKTRFKNALVLKAIFSRFSFVLTSKNLLKIQPFGCPLQRRRFSENPYKTLAVRTKIKVRAWKKN